MYPAEQTELLLEVASLQRHNEAHETNDVQHEADHTMVSREWKELSVGKYNMLQQIYQTRTSDQCGLHTLK